MLLSICIPTYNRCDKVLALLRFLSSELENNVFVNDIEIIVSDNCSTDDTKEMVSQFTGGSNFFIYHRNQSNLGLIGNLHKLVEISQGDYIWFMGDDDVYYKNILCAVYNKLKEKALDYIFVNHCAYKNYKSDGTGFDSAVPNRLISKEYLSSYDILKIFDYSGTSLMFISASVFRRNTIMNCDCSRFDNLALPLYWCFYCASKGKNALISDVMIENQWGEISWSTESRRIFSEYIPAIIKQLPNLGYSKCHSMCSLLVFKYKRSTFYGIYKVLMKKIKNL